MNEDAESVLVFPFKNPSTDIRIDIEELGEFVGERIDLWMIGSRKLPIQPKVLEGCIHIGNALPLQEEMEFLVFLHLEQDQLSTREFDIAQRIFLEIASFGEVAI